ncbi:hypothetical protein [Parasphingorhabdus sp.]|uniref:hypothetical protein n=1 Tax=Parasphingorhabdus sp. TaxID=2709688 RepID=UPI003592FA33
MIGKLNTLALSLSMLPFALSLSKGASGLEAWFDKLTTNGKRAMLRTNGVTTNGLSTSLETNGDF